MNPGDAFGRLTILALVTSRPRRQWLCRCMCGSEKVVMEYALRRGSVRSCGCLRRDRMAAGTVQATHRMTHTPEYRIWSGIKQRCMNPRDTAFDRYGARGVAVAPELVESFERFLAEVGLRPSPKHSIERIDNTRGYECGNIKWATPREQARNRRTNVRLTVDGVTKSVVEWAEQHHLPAGTIRSRVTRGWPHELAISDGPMAKVFGDRRRETGRRKGMAR